MKRYMFAFCAVFAALVAPVAAAKPTPAGTIVLNESGPFTLGDPITFTTAVDNLTGSQWPMVYVECIGADGIDPDADPDVLYGQLDHPDTVFVLGGGWSPWRDNPTVDATCTGTLYAYGGKSRGFDTIRLLAVAPSFPVSGE